MTISSDLRISSPTYSPSEAEESAGSLADFVVSDGHVSYEDDSASGGEGSSKVRGKKRHREESGVEEGEGEGEGESVSSRLRSKQPRKSRKVSSRKLRVLSRPQSPDQSDEMVLERPSRSARQTRLSHLSFNPFYYMCPDPNNSVGKDVIGREREALQIISMIQGPKGAVRPLLIGPEGIGKRSIVEKVAYYLQTHLKHPLWRYTKICCLNAGQIQKVRGFGGEEISIADQFERFVNDAFNRTHPRILYIHHIDKIINVEDGIQIQGLLKKPFPFIASVSGDPTDPEVMKAIARLQKYNFETITLKESSIANVEAIVKAFLAKNPIFPNLVVDDETIAVGVRLAARYITTRPFPIKAINLIQETANALLIDRIGKRSSTDALLVTAKDIATLMEGKTKIAAEDLLNTSVFSEKRFVDQLKEYLVGQDYAIKTVSQTVASYKMGLTDPSKPWGVYLFVGPTGVGKTELAKSLAKHLYQNEEAFIRIDGTEFQESHTISRLIGAPPGYEGHDTGGQLTEALQRNRHVVILFDEFEKAHNEVRRLFLQVFDCGRLTDGRGKTVDCTQALFIMTSNLGSKELFGMSEKSDLDPQAVLKTLNPILIKNLSPELCNRFTAIIPFQPLKDEHIPGVIEVQLKRIADRLRLQADVELSWTKDLVKHFAGSDFDYRLGMRNLCRFIDKSIVDALKEVFSKQAQAFKGKAQVSARDGELVVRLKRKS